MKILMSMVIVVTKLYICSFQCHITTCPPLHRERRTIINTLIIRGWKFSYKFRTKILFINLFVLCLGNFHEIWWKFGFLKEHSTSSELKRGNITYLILKQMRLYLMYCLHVALNFVCVMLTEFKIGICGITQGY